MAAKAAILHIGSSFGSIQNMVLEISFEEFQDGCQLGYQNGTILAILYLHVAQMLLAKFQFNGRCCLKNFKMAVNLDI